MIKETLIVTIILIIFYQVYQNINEVILMKSNEDSSENKNLNLKKDKNDKIVIDSTNLNQKKTKQKNNKNKEVNKKIVSQQSKEELLKTDKPITKPIKTKFSKKSEPPEIKFVHPIYGKPDFVSEIGYTFKIKNPKPWNIIIFNEKTNPNYFFVLNLANLVKQYNRDIITGIYLQWSRYFENNNMKISLNMETFDLLIPSVDENFALTICNLMLNCIKGDLNLKSIIDNNLIDISLAKINKYDIVKSKITEQILLCLYPDIEKNQSPDFEKDLAYNESNTKDEEMITMQDITQRSQSSESEVSNNFDIETNINIPNYDDNLENENKKIKDIIANPTNSFEINNVDGFGAFDNSFGSSYSIF